MPYAELTLEPRPSAEQAIRLARGITEALAEETGKRREVTAVRLAGSDSLLWTIDSEPASRSTAFLEIKITQGSNSPEEKASLIARLHRLMDETLGGLAEASYIVLHEVPAQSWGYAGVTQAARAGGRR